ncbi:MAG TPA: hypothetical protein VEK34_14780 [Methylocella sp.]|nr:hypothetical protein [Methylocella sp.]
MREADSENEGPTEAQLNEVMKQVPRGAAVLAGFAVFLLMLGYSFVYFVIFIPRGVVG